jgi:hypothetical protein
LDKKQRTTHNELHTTNYQVNFAWFNILASQHALGKIWQNFGVASIQEEFKKTSSPVSSASDETRKMIVERASQLI